MAGKKFLMAAPFLLALEMSAGLMADENLLKNPGFGELSAENVPSGWQRECNPLLSVPVAALDEGGAKKPCLITEEWGYLRPQFLTQAVALPAGTKSVTLTADCKGQGTVNLALCFLKGGQPLAMDKFNWGFGEISIPLETQSVQALPQVFEARTLTASVPDGADSVLVKIGSSCDKLNRTNTWGKLVLDKASLVASPQPPPPPKAGSALVEKLADVPGQRDVAPAAKLLMEPPSFDRALLVDNDIKTAPSYMGGPDRQGNASFVFPAAVSFKKVAMYLCSSDLRSVDVYGDADGDGIYELPMASADNLSGTGWLVLDLSPAPVKAVRVQPREGGLCGFRHASSKFSEIKLFADAGEAAKASQPAAANFPPVPRDYRPLNLRQEQLNVPPVKERRFQRMMCADLWMWGVDASKKESKLPDFANNEAFRHNAEICRRAGVDTVMIDLTNSSCWNLMPWPSKVCNGTNENILKPTVDALHKEGFKVNVEIIHNITPFETIKWHYPEEETSIYPDMKQYPSILFGDHVRQNWLTIMDEIMACGADGVGISSDEQYYRGHFMETFPNDEPARPLYSKRFGHELPRHEEDTLAFRQWIQMRHEAIGDQFGYWTSTLKKKYPKIYTNTMLMHYADIFSFIAGTNIPLDVLGARSGITEIGADYMDQYGVAMAAAANGWRHGTMLNCGNLGGTLPDIQHIGCTMWLWMYGGASTNYWRLNWLDDGGSMSAITRAYRISDEIESLGAFDAQPPKSIALLSSRAGLDWQQINAWWGKHDDPKWDRAIEGQRGWFADRSVFDALQRNGHPFQWKFLDRPDQIEDLDAFKVLVIPFAYSVSDAALAKIKAAAAKGATILLFDGQMGGTDEWGEPRQQPALKELVDSGKAVMVGGDILACGSTKAFEVQVSNAVDKALGQGHFKAYLAGAKIDATVLEKSPNEKFVFLINWEKGSRNVGLSIPMPDGKYEVAARDDTGWYNVSIENRKALTPEELKGVSVIVNGETPLILHVKPAK